MALHFSQVFVVRNFIKIYLVKSTVTKIRYSVLTKLFYLTLLLFTELGWSYPCDVWSIGCIIFELYAGHTMFQVRFLLIFIKLGSACVSPIRLTIFSEWFICLLD